MWPLKKNAPVGETQLTNIELLQGTEQWSGSGEENHEGDPTYPEPSVIMEAPPPAQKGPNKRLMGLLVLLGAMGGLALFLGTEDGTILLNSLMGGEETQESASAPAEETQLVTEKATSSTDATAPIDAAAPIDAPAPQVEASAPIPGPATVIQNDEGEKEGTTDTVEESEEEAENEEIAEEPFQYVHIGTAGERSHQKVWEALSQMEEWRQSGQHDHATLLEYFAHGKLWVRLSALEVAVVQGALKDNELKSAAKDIHNNFPNDQARRWMKRVEARNAETYTAMLKLLQL